jgi:ABC-type transport system involved in multi-copper enzyme maturation permease subunit
MRMSAVFSIAELTFREAIRRRFVFAGLLVSFAIIVIGVIPYHFHRTYFFTQDEIEQITAQAIAEFGGHVAEFFAFLFAIALSAGTISNEIDRGVLAVIVPKPIGRWAVYCGKWLGVNLFILPFLFFWVILLQFAIYRHVGHFYPDLWRAYLVMSLYSIVYSSLTFFFSSFTSNLLAIVMPLILASTAWTEGFLRLWGYSLDIRSVQIASKVVVYFAPVNPMSRWFERALNPQLLLGIMRFREAGPTDPPANWIDMGWILGYALIAFLAGMIIFQKRDI